VGQTRQDALRRVIARELDWLAGLRWVGGLEYWLTVAAAVGIAFTAFVAVGQTADPAALSISAAHFMLLVAAVAAAPRRLSWPLLATLVLSLLNYTILLLVHSPLLRTITLGYLWAGCAAGLAALAVGPGLTRRWAAIADYAGRDDFQWLLTAAPLWVRWRFMDELHAVQARQPQPPQA
jgi:hypothetical protein